MWTHSEIAIQSSHGLWPEILHPHHLKRLSKDVCLPLQNSRVVLLNHYVRARSRLNTSPSLRKVKIAARSQVIGEVASDFPTIQPNIRIHTSSLAIPEVVPFIHKQFKAILSSGMRWSANRLDHIRFRHSNGDLVEIRSCLESSGTATQKRAQQSTEYEELEALTTRFHGRYVGWRRVHLAAKKRLGLANPAINTAQGDPLKPNYLTIPALQFSLKAVTETSLMRDGRGMVFTDRTSFAQDHQPRAF